MHLAQLNIAKLTHAIDHPATADFANNLDRINALAEASPGFVWRLRDEDNNATAFRPHPDPDVIINLTVWETPVALREFAYRSVHTDFLRRRREWFTPMDTPAVVAWWVEEGHIPTIDEAFERLAHLTAHGPTAYAFPVNRVVEPDASAAADVQVEASH